MQTVGILHSEKAYLTLLRFINLLPLVKQKTMHGDMQWQAFPEGNGALPVPKSCWC